MKIFRFRKEYVIESAYGKEETFGPVLEEKKFEDYRKRLFDLASASSLEVDEFSDSDFVLIDPEYKVRISSGSLVEEGNFLFTFGRGVNKFTIENLDERSNLLRILGFKLGG